ncbi:MAG: DUF4157 domain-containing protein [Anaerolineaceae bacterium]
MSDFQSADLQERVRAKSNDHEVAPAPEKQRVPGHPVVELQRHLGNAHVARMIAQRNGSADEGLLQGKYDASLQRAEDEAQEDDEEEMMAKHDVSLQRAGADDEEMVQGKHDSSLQREGDEDEVMAKHDSSVQRAGAEEEEMLQGKRDAALQRETEPTIGLEGGAVGSEMSSVINSARGGGTALADGVRTAAESTMGADFSGVRVHQDAQSDHLNRSMTAKAFTTGSDIFLRGDQNSSDTSLMAHELTHVVQQSSGSLGGGGGGMTVGAADDSHEHEADAVAQQVVSGGAQRTQEESPSE